MLIAEDVLLLLTDDATGRSVVDSNGRAIAVAGALVGELAAAGRIQAVTVGSIFRRTELRVVDTTPLGDDVLDTALQQAAARGSSAPASVIDRIRRGRPHERLYARLVERGILRAEQGRVLGIFPTSSWPAADSAHEAEVRRGLHEVLATGRAASPHETTLIALLQAVDAVPKVITDTGLSRRELRARAKVVGAGDVGGDAARKAVEAAQAAAASSAAAIS